MIEKINLSSLKMNHFTEFDAELYCNIFNIKPDNIKELYLHNNNLTDISGVGIFKNLEYLSLTNNPVKDLNFIKDLKELEYLYINNLNLTDELNAVNILKNLYKLEELYCEYTFKKKNIRFEFLGSGCVIFN